MKAYQVISAPNGFALAERTKNMEKLGYRPINNVVCCHHLDDDGAYRYVLKQAFIHESWFSSVDEVLDASHARICDSHSNPVFDKLSEQYALLNDISKSYDKNNGFIDLDILHAVNQYIKDDSEQIRKVNNNDR